MWAFFHPKHTCIHTPPPWLPWPLSGTPPVAYILLTRSVSCQRRIELIQDFAMPTASTTLRISPDNRFVFATGTYKPRVRCYEFAELSMKFERSLDAEGAGWGWVGGGMVRGYFFFFSFSFSFRLYICPQR